MEIGSTSGTSGMSALANELFKRVDGNSDGQLSTSEFQTFLQNLLGQVAGRQQTAGLGTQASAVAPAKTYQPMAGFVTEKLNSLDHKTAKYVFGRATQNVELGTDRASRSAGLDKIAEYIQQNGYPDAKVVGDDTIDFGADAGAFDVLTSWGDWWFGPKGA